MTSGNQSTAPPNGGRRVTQSITLSSSSTSSPLPYPSHDIPKWRQVRHPIHHFVLLIHIITPSISQSPYPQMEAGSSPYSVLLIHIIISPSPHSYPSHHISIISSSSPHLRIHR